MSSLGLEDDAEMSLALPMRVPAWPVYTVVGLSVLGIVSAAVFRAFAPATVTYGVLIIVGCGLLYYRRHLAIAATRKAGGSGYVSIGTADRIALGALVLACLANGVAIALAVAALGWWS